MKHYILQGGGFSKKDGQLKLQFKGNALFSSIEGRYKIPLRVGVWKNTIRGTEDNFRRGGGILGEYDLKHGDNTIMEGAGAIWEAFFWLTCLKLGLHAITQTHTHIHLYTYTHVWLFRTVFTYLSGCQGGGGRVHHPASCCHRNSPLTAYFGRHTLVLQPCSSPGHKLLIFL